MNANASTEKKTHLDAAHPEELYQLHQPPSTVQNIYILSRFVLFIKQFQRAIQVTTCVVVTTVCKRGVKKYRPLL